MALFFRYPLITRPRGRTSSKVYCQRHSHSDREGEWAVPQGTAESQKGDHMAPGGVHAGYKNSLYVYAAEKNPTSEDSFEEWLVELTTGLEMALEGNTEDADDLPEEHKEAYSSRKKDWEEVLEQATVAEVMLRQALENGLGQQEEEEKNRQKQNED